MTPAQVERWWYSLIDTDPWTDSEKVLFVTLMEDLRKLDRQSWKLAMGTLTEQHLAAMHFAVARVTEDLS